MAKKKEEKTEFETKEFELVHKTLDKKFKMSKDEGILAFCINKEGVGTHMKLNVNPRSILLLIEIMREKLMDLSTITIKDMVKEIEKLEDKKLKKNEVNKNGKTRKRSKR